MASRTGGVVRDRAPKGRTPLGDLSNLNEAKRQNSKLSIFSKKDTGGSKKLNTTNKSTSDSEKVKTRGRKVLSDISNSGNPNLNEESKKNRKCASKKLNTTKKSASDSEKKGVLGGRTPLGDLSNLPSKKTINTTKKSTSTNSGKVQTRGRKALSDISNSVNPNLNEESKKTRKAKLFTGASKKLNTTKKSTSNSEKVQTRGRKALSDISNSDPIPEEELFDSDAITEEGFWHNHDKCIKCFESLTRPIVMDSDLFLEMTGLGTDNVISKQQESPISPESPLRYMELSDEESFDYYRSRSWKEDLDSPISCDSSSPRRFSDVDLKLKPLDSPSDVDLKLKPLESP